MLVRDIDILDYKVNFINDEYVYSVEITTEDSECFFYTVKSIVRLPIRDVINSAINTKNVR